MSGKLCRFGEGGVGVRVTRQGMLIRQVEGGDAERCGTLEYTGIYIHLQYI